MNVLLSCGYVSGNLGVNTGLARASMRERERVKLRAKKTKTKTKTTFLVLRGFGCGGKVESLWGFVVLVVFKLQTLTTHTRANNTLLRLDFGFNLKIYPFFF